MVIFTDLVQSNPKMVFFSFFQKWPFLYNFPIFGPKWSFSQFWSKVTHFFHFQKMAIFGSFGSFSHFLPNMAIFPFLALKDPKMTFKKMDIFPVLAQNDNFFVFQKWPFLGLFGPFSHLWPKWAFPHFWH